jgi:hypothetical protein
MPFVNRFASPFAPPPGPFSLLRNHPVMLASSAATAGVLLGAYVAVQLLGTPAKVNTATAAPTPVASQTAPTIASEPAPPIAGTNGSAPTAEPARSDVASADCGKQTWPNISHDCLTSGPRTISTGKPDQSASRATESAASWNVAPTSGLAAKAEPAATPQPTVTARTANTPVDSPKPAETAAVTPTQPVAAEQPPENASPDVAKAKPKRVAKKIRRKPAKQEFNDDGFFASGDDGARDARRYDRSHRVVQRYERDDDDRDTDNGRRVIVIRRGGGGLFGGIFGNFGDSD